MQSQDELSVTKYYGMIFHSYNIHPNYLRKQKYLSVQIVLLDLDFGFSLTPQNLKTIPKRFNIREIWPTNIFHISDPYLIAVQTPITSLEFSNFQKRMFMEI